MNGLAHLMTAESEEEDEKEENEEDRTDEESFPAFSCYVNDTRATVSMGVSPRSTKYIVDACLIDAGSSIFCPSVPTWNLPFVLLMPDLHDLKNLYGRCAG